MAQQPMTPIASPFLSGLSDKRTLGMFAIKRKRHIPLLDRQQGFGLVAAIIVSLLVGMVAIKIAPALLTKYNQSAEVSERKALESARSAVIGYAFAKGKIPTPDTTAGIAPNCVKGAMPSSATALYASLGVNNWGVFGKENLFCMDVNEALKITTSVDDLCQKARAQLAAENSVAPGSVPGPRICRDVVSNRTDTAGNALCIAASAGTPTTSDPAAFVIYSTGNNRAADLANSGRQNGVVRNTVLDRFYESDRRGINNAAGVDHYDDLVVSYPLARLVSDCAAHETRTIAVPAPTVTCKALSIRNFWTSSFSFKTSGNTSATDITCRTVGPLIGNYNNSCQDPTAQVTIYNSPACTGAGRSWTIDGADSNGDGVAQILIVGPSNFFTQ